MKNGQLHLILIRILTKIPIYGNMFCSSHWKDPVPHEQNPEDGCCRPGRGGHPSGCISGHRALKFEVSRRVPQGNTDGNLALRGQHRRHGGVSLLLCDGLAHPASPQEQTALR